MPHSPVQPSPRAARKQVHPLVAGGVIAVALAASLTYPFVIAPRMQEARLARLSIAELSTDLKAGQDDPVYLYYLGRRLNEATNFTDAETILRRASALDPESTRIRDQWARAQVGNGNLTEAFGQLKAYAGSHPNSADSHYLLGKFYFAQQSMDRAVVELKEATRLDPNHADAWQYLAQSIEDRSQALDAARKSVALVPDDYRRFLTLGKILAETGATADARRTFEEAVRLAPSVPETHAALASFILNGNAASPTDVNLAIAHAEQAIKNGGPDASLYLTLGRAMRQAGRDAEAVAPLQEAARRDQNAPGPALLLREVLTRLGRTDEARQWQARYDARQSLVQDVNHTFDTVRVHPDNRAARVKLAKLLARQGDIAGTQRQHSALLRVAADTPPVLAATARDLAAGGHPGLGLPLAEKAATQAKGSPAVYEALGDVYLGLNRTHEAAVAYSRVASYQPQMYDELMARLQKHLLSRKSSKDPAEQAFQEARRQRTQQVGPRTVSQEVLELSRKAVALAPQNPDYLRELMQNLVRRRFNAEAITTGEKLVAVAPNDGIGNALLATLKIERAGPGDLEAAEKHLLTAEADPSVAPVSHYGRGMLALKRQQGEKAVQEFQEAIRIDPSVDTYYYKLASAYRLTGDKAKVAETERIYRAMDQEKRLMALAIDQIAEHPNDGAYYDKAARLFQEHDHPQEAAAIRAEWQRRSTLKAKSTP